MPASGACGKPASRGSQSGTISGAAGAQHVGGERVGAEPTSPLSAGALRPLLSARTTSRRRRRGVSTTPTKSSPSSLATASAASRIRTVERHARQRELAERRRGALLALRARELGDVLGEAVDALDGARRRRAPGTPRPRRIRRRPSGAAPGSGSRTGAPSRSARARHVAERVAVLGRDRAAAARRKSGGGAAGLEPGDPVELLRPRASGRRSRPSSSDPTRAIRWARVEPLAGLLEVLVRAAALRHVERDHRDQLAALVLERIDVDQPAALAARPRRRARAAAAAGGCAAHGAQRRLGDLADLAGQHLGQPAPDLLARPVARQLGERGRDRRAPAGARRAPRRRSRSPGRSASSSAPATSPGAALTPRTSPPGLRPRPAAARRSCSAASPCPAARRRPPRPPGCSARGPACR